SWDIDERVSIATRACDAGIMLPEKWLSREKLENIRKCIYKSAIDYCVGLDFHQDLRRNQSCYLNHRRCWTYFSEHLSVCAPNFFPSGNIDAENPCAHDVLHTGSRFV